MGVMAGIGQDESVERLRFSLASRVPWVGAWLALPALALWMQHLSVLWLLLAAATAGVWMLGVLRGGGSWRLGAAAALWIALGIAGGIQYRLHAVAEDWTGVRVRVEEGAADALHLSLDALVDRGERAVNGAVAAIADDGAHASPETFDRLERIRRSTRVAALAVFAPNGAPLAWAGEHRGMIPQAVRLGEREYTYHDGPLFGYLYFARALDDGRTAVAASLLEATVPVGARRTPFADRFAARHGITPLFTEPERARGESVWDWSTDEGPILSVSFAALTQERWHERLAERGRRGVGAVWMAALVLLSLTWYRGRAGPPGVPIAVGTLGLLLMPLGSLVGMQGVFSPLHFVLPLPGDITLGELLVFLMGGALWLLTQPPTGRLWERLPLLLRAGLAGLVVPLAIELVRLSAAPGMLAAGGMRGVPLQLATVLLLAVPFFLLLRLPPRGAEGKAAVRPAALGLLLSVALGLGLVLVWQPDRPVPLWTGIFWALPFALLALALRRRHRMRDGLMAWLAAGWLAGTAALPNLWALQVESRLEVAESELARLGTEADPFLDFLLRQFADRAVQLATEGEQGVNLLYRSWVASGLAREGYEARITLWRGAEPTAELRLSDLELPPPMVPEMLATAREASEPVLERYAQLEAVHYLLTVPLPDEQVVSVAVPPRRRLGRVTALARFLDPAAEGVEERGVEDLTLIPVHPGEIDAPALPDTVSPTVEWVRTRAGWRSEALVHFPSGLMHAHLVVRTFSLPLLLVRALLVQVAILACLILLWALARTLCGDPLGFPASRWQWLHSFRGRLTLVLFAFFLVPTVTMGAVAYGALSREVVRAEAALAQRSGEQAAPEAAVEPLPELGRRVRADLLLYRHGTLVDASAPEVLDLGLFHTWLSPEVYLTFLTGEETHALEERRLATNEYLMAYRRLAPDHVLAVPTPLATGEIARRQRAFAEVVLLAVLLGAALSVVLSLAVGRAFSRPIETLSRATAAVGAGNLRVRLPEGRPDEFGGVFRSFNRMVRRLRRARAAELRSARVLAWGEMARQVAHEIKNPLTPIKLSVQHLRRAYADGRSNFGEILDRNVEAVLQEIDRLSEIARAFARFGAPDQARGSLEAIELEQVVEETLTLYRGGPSGIEYRAIIDPATPPALARTGELKEVLINLLENAREALDGGGEIRIAAAPEVEDGWVWVEVTDTGEGIPPEVLRRIFEPQFSTRTSGTGLGLAIVRRLVESWGGEVTAESEPGVGTTVHLRLRSADGAG